MAITATLTTVGVPTNFTATPNTASGTLPAGTYYYKIIAVVSSSVLSTFNHYQSAPSAEISAVLGATGKVDLSWTAVAGATGYMIWRTKVSGDYRHKVVYSGGVTSIYYKCKVLRPSTSDNYQRHTTTGTTYSDDGTVTTTEATQGSYAYEHFDYGIPKISISGGDSTTPLSMEYLYQQDVTNAWGVITRTGDAIVGYTYEVKALIYATASVYWREEKYFNTWILRSGLYLVGSTSDVQLGIESSYNARTNGVRIIAPAHTGYFSAASIAFGGTSKFYGCEFICKNTQYEGFTADNLYAGSGSDASQTGRLYIQFNALYTLKDCNFFGSGFSNSFVGGSAFLIERCNLRLGSRTFSMSGTATTGTVLDTYIYNIDSSCINIEGNISWTFRGGKLQSPTSGRDVLAAYEAKLTLIDTEFTESKLYFYSGQRTAGNYAKFTLQNSVNLKLLNEQNSPIVGATINLYDKNGTVVFTKTTDSSGLITESIVTRATYDPANNTNHFVTAGEKTDLSPFTLKIQKSGYNTYIEKFTMSDKVNWTIAMKRSNLTI